MADQKPNLREAGEKDAKARDQALQAAVTQIENGGGGMPPFKDQLSEQEIADVAAFVSQQ